MFENIKFHQFYMRNQYADKSENFWFDKMDAEKVENISEYTAGLNADYCIEGSIMTLPLRLVSDYAKQNYLYVQSFGLMHADASFYTKRKDYASYLIIFTYEGQGFLNYEGKEYILQPGDGFIIDCKKPHYYRTEGSHWFHSILHFNGNPMQAFQKVYTDIVKFTFDSIEQYNNLLIKLLKIYISAPAQMELQISAGLYYFLTQIVMIVTLKNVVEYEAEQNMNKIADYIEKHYNSQLSLDSLSKYIGLSKYHMIREFKKHKGYTPYEYLIRVRLEQAKSLLRNTSYPIATIAEMVGINDLNNFNYLFKKHEMITPGTYRKK